MTATISTRSLVKTQVRFQVQTFMRIPVAAFFTLALPLVMLVLINALVSDGFVATDHGDWPVRQFFTVGLAAFAAVSATYTNFANIIPVRRDQGVLKRWHGTPLPSWAYIAGMIGSAIVIALTGVIVIIGLGVAVYGLEVDPAKLPAAIMILIVGVGTFAALGIAVGSMIPSPAAAPAVANGTVLPLAFISNVFIPLEDPPTWLEWAGAFFPLKPFVTSFQDAFNPAVQAPAIPWGSLAWLTLWGIVGVAGAVRYFQWEPNARNSAAPERKVDAP